MTIHFEFLPQISNEKIFKDFDTAISHAPWRPYFLSDQICLANFVERHLVTIPAKLFSILTTGFRGEDF